jgi:hypothetical protein
VAWNRASKADRAAEVNALAWSIIAMADVTERLAKAKAWDRPRAFAVVSEAVWWVTIVDATLVRYHPEAYDQALSGVASRVHTEETLAGLRFVRNQIGQGIDHVDFIRPATDRAEGEPDRVGDWAWSSQPEPACALLSPQGKTWEMARYRAYQTRLAGHAVGETFTDAAKFLNVAADRASDTEAGLLSDQARVAQRGL